MGKKKKTKVHPPPPKLEDVCADIPDTIKDVKLAKAIEGLPYKEVTVNSFCKMMENEAKNRKEIAQFVYDRFHQRYLLPFEKISSTINSGFAQMAVCCLMIEALESFQNGWDDTREVYDKEESRIYGGDIFESFFSRYEEFEDFKGLGQDFYFNVRCGILHQAESKNGWLIGRKGALYSESNKSINSTKFRYGMKKCLKTYCGKLQTAEESSEIWGNFKTKMAYIIQNCNARQ